MTKRRMVSIGEQVLQKSAVKGTGFRGLAGRFVSEEKADTSEKPTRSGKIHLESEGGVHQPNV